MVVREGVVIVYRSIRFLVICDMAARGTRERLCQPQSWSREGLLLN